MNFNPFKLKTNSLILIGVILLMAIFYFFYFEIYVKNNENRLITAYFRVLNQMGENVEKKINVYIRNADDLKGKVKPLWNEQNKNSKDSLAPQKEKLLIDTLNIGNDLNKNRKDSLTPQKEKLLIDTLNNEGDLNKNIKLVKFIIGSDHEKQLTVLKEKESVKNFYFYVKLDDPPFGGDKANHGALMVFRTPYEKLLKSLVRENIFDGMVIVRDSNIIFNTLRQQMLFVYDKNIKKNLKNEELQQKASSEIPLLHIGRIISGEVLDMNISNIPYKAFFNPFRVNDETWFAIGLIKKQKFNASSRSIEPWIIISLSMLLVFIVLGLPVIKLKVLSKIEQLDTKNIIDYALFVILGGAFLVMFVSFLAQNYVNKQRVDKNLAALSDTIYGALKKELQDACKQLDAYDSLMLKKALEFQKNTYNSNVIINILSDTTQYYPRIYPYGDYYFWTDKNGVQTEYLTPIKTYGKLSDLSSRDYVNKKDEWFLPGRTNKKFRIESIVSITSGTVKAAISQKGMDTVSRPVVAVSTKMYSIINTILPINYSFCIIDKTGLVWFHSNPELNLKENFTEECDYNKYLESAMYSNISKSINVNYYNSPYRIHIKPLDKLPLYLIVMFNKKNVKSFQAETITFTLIFIGLSLFILFFQIMVLLLIELHFKQTFSRNLLIKLTRPIKRLNGKYVYLIKLNIIITITTVVFLAFYKNMSAVTSILSLTIILFAYSYRLLNDNETKKRHKERFILFNFLMFITVTAIGIYITPKADMWQIIVFDLVIILIIVLAHKFLNKETKNNNRYWLNYTWLLVTILVLMGIIPSLKFYETGYNNESEIRTRHKMLELMKEREKRNDKIIGFYSNVNYSKKRDSIIKERENLGIYTRFDDDTKFLGNCLPALKNKGSNKNHTPLSDNNRWDTILCYIRPFYDKYIIENKYLLLNDSSDNINWDKNKNELLLKYNSLNEDPEKKKVTPVCISSYVPLVNFIAPLKFQGNSFTKNFFSNLAFWILIILIIFIFFRLLKFGIYRIFNHYVIQNYIYQDFITSLKELLGIHNNIFIVRLSPLDHTNDLFEDLTQNLDMKLINWNIPEDIKETPGIINEFKERPSEEQGKNHDDVILITGFDEGLEDTFLMREKLDMINILLDRKDIKIVMALQVKLSHTIKYFKKRLNELENNISLNKDEKSAKADIYLNIIDDLTHLDKLFYTRFIPVRYKYPKSFEEKYETCSPKILSKDEIIENELSAGDYLMRFKDTLVKFKETCIEKFGKDFPDELLTEKIFTIAKPYYEDIFNNCSPEEQYILLDLAHDLIINPKNDRAIYTLLNKGILVRKSYKINLMNKSFLKFVVTKLYLAKKLEAKLSKGKDTQTWQGYKVTLILIILSLFTFIAMANHDFIDNLNKMFVAIGGAIAVITSIVGLLSHKRKTVKE